MQTITKYLALVVLMLNMHLINAQDTIQSPKNQEKIESLKELKEKIQNEEKDFLKSEVEAITIRLEKGEISNSEAETLKMEAAKKRALNIKNRLAIVDNKISLLKRNENGYEYEGQERSLDIIRIGSNDNTSESFIFIGDADDDKPKNRKYDRRTKSDFVLAFGFNNAIIDGENLNDSPYKFGGSRFFEMGWAWKTRVFENSNFVRLKYGVSLQVNGLKPSDNQYFVQNNDETYLEDYPIDLKKSKLTISNLVFPVHFEFGPSKKIDKDTYFRYFTSNQFKIGLGGYVGFNVGTRQKLKYMLDGEHVKDKQKRGFNTTNLVYGLSGYLAFGDTALYVKYDLSPIFNNQAVDQHNISVGVRFDVD